MSGLTPQQQLALDVLRSTTEEAVETALIGLLKGAVDKHGKLTGFDAIGMGVPLCRAVIDEIFRRNK